MYKFLNEDVIDVWFGNGWYNWARFEIRRIKGKVFLNKINGRAIPNQLFSNLCKELEQL